MATYTNWKQFILPKNHTCNFFIHAVIWLTVTHPHRYLPAKYYQIRSRPHMYDNRQLALFMQINDTIY